ncbi:hypothetical protein OOJ91_21350 [Micromonospora lupini]|uniref:hypothetical protein n=1 Tax=Micromonospora lupini TaxID=285679 RepID=UPI0022545F88|nr:hypothetical protein [Micromonospora lupini]MCX5068390.1 hypothetical protein [Micromonospora lupini]
MVDAAANKAAVGRFLEDHAHVRRADNEHPALRGCAEIVWSEIPGCPADVPSLFYGLLDQVAAPEAARLLTNVLMSGVFHLSAAMPAALPFLLRLTADPGIPVRSDLLDLVVVTAELSRPVDADNERAVLLLGNDSDHPEREQCRAVFSAHASVLRTLLDDDGLNSADRTLLQQVVGLH